MTAAATMRRVPHVALCLESGTAQVGAVQAHTGNGVLAAPFEGTVYSGGVITDRPWWGNLVIDLDTLKLPTKPISVLQSHDPLRIVGYTEDLSKSGGRFTARGKITDATAAGAEMLRLLEAKHPLQMSWNARPRRIEELQEGASVKVNGFELKGPATIFRDTSVGEVTITPTGADSDTSVALLESAGCAQIPVVVLQPIADDEKLWRAEWNTDAALRAEFGSRFESYAAWRRHEKPAAPALTRAATAPLPSDLMLDRIEQRAAAGDAQMLAMLRANDARALLVERLLSDRAIALEFHNDRQVLDAYLRSLLPRTAAGRAM